MKKPDISEIRAYRELHECSLAEAWKAIRKKNILEAIDDLPHIEASGRFKELLKEIVDAAL